MPSSKEAFATLTGKLRDALAANDWEAIARLDDECRAQMATLNGAEALDVGLREQLAELSQLYLELQQSGRAERERLAAELIRLNQSKQVRQAYEPLG
ncbi:flagellar protein FliT [Stutzerimonas stutzeri]|uniref:flagellar protein FliT n=1 Tax=Stutzerimonas stutzeri TaxID=316 RepID=UPI001C2E9FEA|nr:flagellar protein FliT [Stutzerimonas stutzeri]